MRRPKSALIVNIPICFLQNSDAVTVKAKFKQCFETSDFGSSLFGMIKNNNEFIDKGPSLFNQRFTTYNRGKSFKESKKVKPFKLINRVSMNLLRQNIKVIEKNTNDINKLISAHNYSLNINSSTLFKDIEHVISTRRFRTQKIFNNSIR